MFITTGRIGFRVVALLFASGMAVGKASHRGKLGIFDAPQPWEPWTTVVYEEHWGQGHVPVNTFYWNFFNKWLSSNGTHFSLIFTGRKENDSWNVLRGVFTIK